jgi:mycobactin lysine-N-oxygenase
MTAMRSPGASCAMPSSVVSGEEASRHDGASSPDADLVVVGAGAKAAAIATKVHVLNSLGLGSIALTIIEATEPAASWSGRNGMTSGEEPLAITPIKDVGFPYESHQVFGEAGGTIDRAVMSFSWQQYLIDKRGYARWVNAGSPTVQHREYGRYLAWVLARANAGVSLVRGRVTQVSLQRHADRWAVDVAESSGRSEIVQRRYGCGALALTGPGVHRLLAHDPDAAPRIFHCDSRRNEFARIPRDQSADIGIVGGGESALSCVAFLRAFRPDAQLTVYTTGLPLSRGESFLENRVFSDPDDVDWSSLDLELRRDFVKHCDRGVFDPNSLASLAYDEHCRFVIGRVVHVASAGPDRGVSLDYASVAGVVGARHDYVVNCTGFDLLEQLRGLFPTAVRAEIERRVGALWDTPPATEIPIGRFLELEGMHPRLHIPGLAALSQGPGFANLGCLGLLANRVLAPFFLDEDRPGPVGHASIPEVV